MVAVVAIRPGKDWSNRVVASSRTQGRSCAIDGSPGPGQASGACVRACLTGRSGQVGSGPDSPADPGAGGLAGRPPEPDRAHARPHRMTGIGLPVAPGPGGRVVRMGPRSRRDRKVWRRRAGGFVRLRPPNWLLSVFFTYNMVIRFALRT